MNRRSFLARSLGGVLFFPAVHLSNKMTTVGIDEARASVWVTDVGGGNYLSQDLESVLLG